MTELTCIVSYCYGFTLLKDDIKNAGFVYNKALSNAGDIFLESGMFGESALVELNIVWD
jgi:hypothetical protein